MNFLKLKKDDITEKKILNRRANRWVFVNLIIASSPILITLMIGLFFDFISLSNIVLSAINEGTIIILAIGIAGNQYLTFAYSRDYDKLDAYTMSKISIIFWIIVVISVIGFTSLKIANSLIYNNIAKFKITQTSVTILSFVILCFALLYTRWAHLLSLNYQRIEGNLNIPIIDNNDPGFENK